MSLRSILDNVVRLAPLFSFVSLRDTSDNSAYAKCRQRFALSPLRISRTTLYEITIFYETSTFKPNKNSCHSYGRRIDDRRY
jgi:hypothetical protein